MRKKCLGLLIFLFSAGLEAAESEAQNQAQTPGKNQTNPPQTPPSIDPQTSPPQPTGGDPDPLPAETPRSQSTEKKVSSQGYHFGFDLTPGVFWGVSDQARAGLLAQVAFTVQAQGLCWGYGQSHLLQRFAFATSLLSVDDYLLLGEKPLKDWERFQLHGVGGIGLQSLKSWDPVEGVFLNRKVTGVLQLGAKFLFPFQENFDFYQILFFRFAHIRSLNWALGMQFNF